MLVRTTHPEMVLPPAELPERLAERGMPVDPRTGSDWVEHFSPPGSGAFTAPLPGPTFSEPAGGSKNNVGGSCVWYHAVLPH